MLNIQLSKLRIFTMNWMKRISATLIFLEEMSGITTIYMITTEMSNGRWAAYSGPIVALRIHSTIGFMKLHPILIPILLLLLLIMGLGHMKIFRKID